MSRTLVDPDPRTEGETASVTLAVAARLRAVLMRDAERDLDTALDRFRGGEVSAEVLTARARALQVAADHARAVVGLQAALERKYSPDQPRDDHGRWTSGGGTSGRVSDRAAHAGDGSHRLTRNDKSPGHPVMLPNGHTIPDSRSPTGLLMSPVSSLQNVADAGRYSGAVYMSLRSNPETAVGAPAYLLTTIGSNVGQGGTFDYQRSGNFLTGFTHLTQFRNVSNYNVGLFMQQTGLFRLDEVLSIAGFYASVFSSNYKPNNPYGLDAPVMEWITKGYNAGVSGAYGDVLKF